MGEGAVVTEVGAGGADQDPVVDPAVDPDADPELLTFEGTGEGATLDQHHQALSGAGHLEPVNT